MLRALSRNLSFVFCELCADGMLQILLSVAILSEVLSLVALAPVTSLTLGRPPWLCVKIVLKDTDPTWRTLQLHFSSLE